MTGRIAGVLCLLLAGPSGVGRADTPPAPPSAALAKLLSAADAGGQPVVGPKAREYYDGLPGRARELAEKVVADEVITSPQHLAAILSLGMPVSVFEVAMEDRCFLCHSDPEVHTGDTLFSPDPAAAGVPSHMNLATVVQDVHFRRGLSCAGCHGGDPTATMGHDHPASWPEDAERRKKDRRWIPEFCGRCHSDSAFMRQFDPGLPTDQLAKFRQSRHGMLLAAGDSRAAQCVSCHGVHGIQGAKSPRSSIYPTRVPETCGTCHADAKLMAGFRLPDGSPMPTNQLEQYRASVHGKALLERGDLGAPACNDCHGNHAAMPPQVASVAQICRTCHARNGTLFDGSKHKKAFVAHGWPECDVCHGKHEIAKTSDALLAPEPGSLCQGCHAKYATGNPECTATAAYFHQELVGLAASKASFTEQAELLARKGLDADPMHEQLLTLSDSLQQSRSYIHAFDRSEFDQATAPGRASIASLTALEGAAAADLRYRRVGLLIAVTLIWLLMLLLWIKLRRMESPGD
jgi:predicted CXXCH cytochrome family protein